MLAFSGRNLKVFFKDRASVFFSLLAVFIIIGLYVLFLGDVWTSGNDLPGIRFLMDSWIMAGLLGVTSITTTMGAFEAMVSDKVDKKLKDFASSPISRARLTGGYILSAIVIGIIMTLVALVLAEVYIIASGGELLGLVALIKVLGLVLLSVISSTSMVLFLVSFFNSRNAFTSASTVIGTLIGFLTGIYLPIGQLPEAVQWIIKCFPPSHAAVLLRQVMMEKPLEASFAGLPVEAAESFKETMGVVFNYNGTIGSPMLSIAVLAASAVLFFLLAAMRFSKKVK